MLLASDEIDTMKQAWDEFDFFLVHYKYSDSTGEDGLFDEKVRRIEEFDAHIPSIMELQPDVLIATGDHSTPSALRAHRWHPVPLLLAARTCRPDRVMQFGEQECLLGGLGQIEARYILPLALAHTLKLKKYGA